MHLAVRGKRAKHASFADRTWNGVCVCVCVCVCGHYTCTCTCPLSWEDRIELGAGGCIRPEVSLCYDRRTMVSIVHHSYRCS
jgi:hypothetical protein